MLGVKLGTMLIVPFNGDRVVVEPMGKDTTLVRIPLVWAHTWLDRAREICDAVDAVSTAPEREHHDQPV